MGRPGRNMRTLQIGGNMRKLEIAPSGQHEVTPLLTGKLKDGMIRIHLFQNPIFFSKYLIPNEFYKTSSVFEVYIVISVSGEKHIVNLFFGS